MNFWYGKQICVCWTFSVKYYLLVSQANRFNMAFTVGNLFLCHWFDLSQLWTRAAIMRQTTMRKQQSYYSLIESVLVIIPWIIIIIYMQLECSLRCYSDSVITIWFTSPYNGCNLSISYFIHVCYFSDSLAFVSGWILCLMMFCLFLTYI